VEKDDGQKVKYICSGGYFLPLIEAAIPVLSNVMRCSFGAEALILHKKLAGSG